MITFTGHPLEDSQESETLAGGYINAWIDAQSESEGLTRARRLIEECAWIVDSVESVAYLCRLDYRDGDEGLEYFDQAIIDGEVLVFHTWPHEKRTLPRHETELLLGELCTKLGFCLPPLAYEQFTNKPPIDINEFTDAVFFAEGLVPSRADRHLYRQVRAMVADAFARNGEDDET